MILNQGKEGACAPYAVLGALITLKPDIDWQEIEKEMRTDKTARFSIPTACRWLQSRGYIKGFKKVNYTPFLTLRQPVIMHATKGNWVVAGKPPYFLGKDENKIVGHVVFLPRQDKKLPHAVMQNSWGDQWGDKGYCYANYETIRKYSFYTISV